MGRQYLYIFKKSIIIIKQTNSVLFIITICQEFSPMSVIKYSSPHPKEYCWSKFKQLLHLSLSGWTSPIAPPLEHWPCCMLQGSRVRKIVMCRWFEWGPTDGSRGVQRKFWGNENIDKGLSFWEWVRWGESKPSIFNTLHPNTALGYKDDRICGKLHAIHFPSRDAISKLSTGLDPKTIFISQLCHFPSCVLSGKSLNLSGIHFPHL